MAWLILKICLLVTVFLAFVFMAIGYGLPWVCLSYNNGALPRKKDHEFERALWYNKLCPDDRTTCTSSTHGDLQIEIMAVNNADFETFANISLMEMKYKEEWVTWQACSTTSLILTYLGGFLAVYLVWYTISRHYRYRNCCAILGCFLLLVASCLMWIPVGMVADMTEDLKDAAKIWEENMRGLGFPQAKYEIGKPVGLILAAIGAFFAFVAAILFLLFICHPKPAKKYARRPRYNTMPYYNTMPKLKPFYTSHILAPQYSVSPMQSYIMNGSSRSYFTGDDYFTHSHNAYGNLGSFGDYYGRSSNDYFSRPYKSYDDMDYRLSGIRY